MNKIAVIFWTGTGNTEVMANEVVAGAKEAGADVTLFNTSDFTVDKAQEFDKFALGCPAMGAEELEDSEFQPLYDHCGSAYGRLPVGMQFRQQAACRRYRQAPDRNDHFPRI